MQKVSTKQKFKSWQQKTTQISVYVFEKYLLICVYLQRYLSIILISPRPRSNPSEILFSETHITVSNC